MPRFICSHPTTSLIKHITPSGKVLAFDYRGVLETDEEGAAVIRADPLYGRLILEGDESAPAHGEVPAHGTSPVVVLERGRPARRPATRSECGTFCRFSMGHANIQTTLNTYGHLMPQAFAGVGERLDGLLYGTRTAPDTEAVAADP